MGQGELPSNPTSITNCPTLNLLRGRDGTSGRDGRDGQTGTMGPQGLRGEKGERGPSGGPPGLTGPQGVTGLRGATGRQGPPGPRSGGVVYTRWGSHSCPSISGTELVYAGRVGGSHYGDQGGGSNHLCMPPNPDYNLRIRSGVQGHSYVYGTEYFNLLHTGNI